MKPRKDDIFDQVRKKLVNQQQKRFGVRNKSNFRSATTRFAFSEDAFSSAWQHSKRTNSPYIVEDTITKERWEVSVQLISDETNKEIVRKIDTTPVLVS